MLLTNAFSLNMLPADLDDVNIRIRKVAPSDVPANLESVIGHPDTARVAGQILGREVPANRVTVTVEPGDTIYVAQYRGPRLAPGTTELPEGASITFYRVQVVGRD